MNRRVPDAVANAAAACGAGGWLRDLSGLIAELEAEWSVSVGRPFPHSSEAFVAEASLADGTPAVLKLLIPQDGAAGRREITMLRLTGGRGCVGLLRDDDARGALLLERLGAQPLRAGPLTRRTTGDTGDRGGQRVAVGVPPSGGF
jgi:streptomycin 6-kinase